MNEAQHDVCNIRNVDEELWNSRDPHGTKGHCVCVCVCVCVRARALVGIKIKFKEKFDAFGMMQVRYQYFQKRLGHLVLGWRVTKEGEL